MHGQAREAGGQAQVHGGQVRDVVNAQACEPGQIQEAAPLPAARPIPHQAAVQLELQRAELWAEQLVRLQHPASVVKADTFQILQCWEVQLSARHPSSGCC